MNESNKKNILLEVTSLEMKKSRKYVEPYSHFKRPQKYTQPQMLTTLILRSDLKITYLGIIGIIETSGQLQKRLLVKRRPNFSTLKYIADRSQMLEIIEIMLANIIQKFRSRCRRSSPRLERNGNLVNQCL
ncbi:hypothetical protein [Gimesia sp.]|uniref:hypothetical protein n=1 Tax=Gimesia sp. TaxID=2024833 RepID=UPI000C69E583|nr:hypothetical protein [Gimesia sp.]MAX39021.1 hypothetical protein [Gimesia sp.]HAH47641.1 hypothetical protein [Planctomycetaceae bacterium]HBL43487.1 hypothetical protein [Planctomycetaceae bacterium]|tara:strand:- start:40430 stop:40822 length:393 start_codon:yes stop_codon:yes gene_type:complete